ncbi:unnamed protein product [Adineta steineri]|uniref:Uncharacterized protein n=1 Tax=Adineta steineri TaxID=433720 RepID=A0A818NTM1_9BILA|nr:unnamed protein product [Adineta steineri]CAF3612822.1 unnamed protein product [Adineta steineri]
MNWLISDVFDQYGTTIYLFTGLVILAWLYNKFRVNRSFFSTPYSMDGKTVLITGGASGIGYETAKDLLQHGARVILADYNMKKGYEAINQLCFETKCNKKNIRLMQCDLRSLKSVREFVRLYKEEEERLDVLICNAGIAWAPDILTENGFSTVMQVNYLSHFLLTNLLLDKLKQCRPSRIVSVASGSHRTVRSIDWSDAFTQFKSIRLWGIYPVSKAFTILFAHKLKHDLNSNDIAVFTVNPSWVWTSIQSPMRDAIGFIAFLICYPLLYILKFILAKTPKTGARTSIFCAVEPSLQHSHELYFEDCAVETVSFLCKNDAIADRLWKLSCEAVGL